MSERRGPFPLSGMTPDQALLEAARRELASNMPVPPPPAPGENAAVGPDADRLHRVVAELARRKVESLALYEPLPEQEAFHACSARVRVLRGSNRGGKTLPAAVEAARAVTGKDPHAKFRTTNGRLYAVGKNLDHVGEVMWRKMGRAGAFRIIRDPRTKLWRAFRPWNDWDYAYKEKSKEAPPLIPPRLVSKIAWENKSKGIPKLVILSNGWEIGFYSSEGHIPQGSDLDAWWFDEELFNEAWYPEMRARLLDRNGLGWWSATPQAGTDVLFDLHEKAMAQLGRPNPTVKEFLILLADNRHMGEQEKKDLAEDLSEEERLVRIQGEFALGSWKIYPGFNMSTHGMDLDEVPHDWTRYMIVDPGHSVCACLFAAVPPPNVGDFILCYDELYVPQCDAGKFADAVKKKTQGQQFYAFVMDMHMGVHTEVGTGINVLTQYTNALENVGVSSTLTGHSFRLASDDVQGGISAVRGWIAPGENGLPTLRVRRGWLPHLEDEIKRYVFERRNGVVTDKPSRKRYFHMMDCLRYLAMHQPVYAPPRKGSKPASAAVRALRSFQRQFGRQSDNRVRFGPGRRDA